MRFGGTRPRSAIPLLRGIWHNVDPLRMVAASSVTWCLTPPPYARRSYSGTVQQEQALRQPAGSRAGTGTRKQHAIRVCRSELSKF